MRLISLSANQKSFKTVKFKATGANFILAKQENPKQEDNNKTYNGVGKSLLVALINFCLGASAGNKITKSLAEKLPEWCFILKIEHDNQVYSIERCAKNTNEINFNGKFLSLKDFYSEMKELCFKTPKNIDYLTYRTLIPFFIRPSRQSYMSYDTPGEKSTPYQKQLYNAFLLGLNVALSQKKMHLKKEFDETRAADKSLKSDPILRDFFQEHGDPSLALIDLEEKINLLSKDLKNFEVADDYYQIKEAADKIKKQIDETQNNLVLKNNMLHNIRKSLAITPDISRQDILKIYDETKLILQEDVKMRLDQLEQFYQELTSNRTKRLKEQQQLVKNDIEEINHEFIELKAQLDKKLQFLNAHRALDVFTKVSNQLSELERQKEKLQSYEKLQNEYRDKKDFLKKEMLVQNDQAKKYLDEEKAAIDDFRDYFRSLVRKFYPNAQAGITVRNNYGSNQIRYDIDAKIESDASDGINSVKLFCYDLTLLRKSPTHNINFIFHDSRLFSDIDEKHSNIMFSTVKDEFADGIYQYIATVNQNQINGLSSEFKEFLKKNTILELTDNADSGKLLGIKVELEYDN